MTSAWDKFPNDGLTIPDFLLVKNRPKNKKSVVKKAKIVVDSNEDHDQSKFVPTVLPSKKTVVKNKKYVPDVQTKIFDKGTRILSEIEGMLDDNQIDLSWSVYDYARKAEWNTLIANRVANHFEPRANELLEALVNKDDKDLQYAYRGYSTDELTNLAAVYQSLVDEAKRYAANNKKIHIVRKKKLPSMEKVLKHFVYAKTDKTYKIASIDPSLIIGAQALWVFHPKSKVLTVFRAIDRGGLNIRRSAIMNYDEKTSIAKRMGRKTEERLETILNGGKVALRKIFDSFIGEKQKITRITKNHILLRVET